MKTDWAEHAERYRQMREKQQISIREYADLYGLNANTARRYLGEGDSKISQSKAAKTPQAKRSPAKNTTPKRSNDRKRRNDHSHDRSSHSEKQDTSSKIKELSAKVEEARQRTPSPDANNESVVLVGEVISAVSARPKSGRASDQSKSGGRVLAGMLKPTDEDMKKASQLLDQAGVDAIERAVIEKSLVNLYALERSVDLVMESLESLTQEDGEPSPVVKAVSITAAAAAAMNDTARTLASVRQSYVKEQREQDNHLRKLSEPKRVMEAYELRREKDWSATDTAIYIEANGFKVPPLLLEMARAEMKAGLDKNDVEAVLVDLDELDKQARENHAKRQVGLEEMLAAKREAVNEIVDAGGFGDIAADGSLNDEELASDFEEGEEADHEINNLLYGETNGQQEE